MDNARCWHMWPVGDEGCHEWSTGTRHGCIGDLRHDGPCWCLCGHEKRVVVTRADG